MDQIGTEPAEGASIGHESGGGRRQPPRPHQAAPQYRERPGYRLHPGFLERG